MALEEIVGQFLVESLNCEFWPSILRLLPLVYPVFTCVDPTKFLKSNPTTVLSCQVRERLGKLLEELTERIIKDRDEHNRTARGLTVGEGVPVQ